MNHRDRMLGAILGQSIDAIPWVPRMDLWFIAHRARGTLPPELLEADEVGISSYFDFACHALAEDPTLTRSPEDYALWGLGVARHPDFPYRLELHDLPIRHTGSFDEMATVIVTSRGEVSTRMSWTEEMRRSGISAPIVTEHAVKSPADLEAVAEIFEHLEVVPTPEGYEAYRDRVGERGLAVAYGGPASPLHLLLHDLMAMEEFFYLWADDRPAMESFGRRLDPFFEAVLGAVSQCSAEVVFWGGNYDQDITWPAFFTEAMVPWIRRASDGLHAAGKLLLSHTDGENQRLLPFYAPAGIDVAQSFCPAPMTRVSLREMREGMGADRAVWGGIPSIALVPDSIDDVAFEAFLDALPEQVGNGRRLILSVSDMVPPDADLGRLRRIGDRIAALGAPAPA